MEVVVVDDGSSCDLAPLVESCARESLATVRMVRQEPSGLTAARNRGAAEACGSILAYLDDDTLLATGWAAAVLEAFEETACDALAGRVELQFEAPRPRWVDGSRLRLYLSELDLGPGPRAELPPNVLPVGANCAVRRDAFERLGGFRPGFDRMGASLLSNGDLEFFGRLRAAGGLIVYEPAAQVRHRVPAERLTFDWFKQRAYAQGISDVLLAAALDSRSRSAREVIRAMRAAPVLARNLLSGQGPTNARLWLWYCRGRRHALRCQPSSAPHAVPVSEGATPRE